ncbi:MAG: DUF5658 family protein [Armatimonadota bacterium]|nr:DUF5658 family protein [Armatimonadota bacterium]
MRTKEIEKNVVRHEQTGMKPMTNKGIVRIDAGSVEKLKRLQPAKESYILLAICLIDLMLTIWLVSTQRATEGNPLMAFYLKRGWDSLIIVKTLLVVLPLFIAEWGRIHRPKFVKYVLRFAIVAYLVTLSIAFVNKDMLAFSRQQSHPPTTPARSFSADISSCSSCR